VQVVLARAGSIIARTRIPTTAAGETLHAVVAQLDRWNQEERIAALGIASFGPVRVTADAADHGCMLETPKQGWSGVAIADILTSNLNCPWRIDTDVNAAALAEWRWGAGHGLTSLCYITIGTGVGGGIVLDGTPLHGALHPEIGHLRLRRAPADRFIGTCPFHGDCVEGLISGPALEARFGCPPAVVPANDPRWVPVQHDLAELIAAVSFVASPQRVLVGGGVGMGCGFLIDQVRDRVPASLNGYLPHISSNNVESFIMHPALGNDAGPLGAIALGEAALGLDHASARLELA